MAVKYPGIVAPENRNWLEPSLLERRKSMPSGGRMTKYDSPMGSEPKPLPVAPYGEVLNREQRLVMEQALNELASRRNSREQVIDAGLDELRSRRTSSQKK